MTPINSKSINALQSYSRKALIEACLEVAGQTHAIFTKLYPESALAAAVHADTLRSIGAHPISPIAGLPVSIKDLLDVAGEITLAGSIALRDAPPAKEDAQVVKRLRQAGAAVLGKTNMTEFAYSGVGLNPHYGIAANPADQTVKRIPGGSSSGAAVSVATGLCIAAIGSDTGGSIRIPAALCGLSGFKPTARRVPTSGAIPLSVTLDTICAMANTVEDCILMDRIIANDVLIIPALSLKGLRLAVPQTLLLEELDHHVATSFAATLTLLSNAGANIIHAPMRLLAEYRAVAGFSGAEAYAWHQKLISEREHEYDPRVAKRIQLGASMLAHEYIHLHAQRKHWIAAMQNEFTPFDAVIMPTVPIVAPVIAELEASDDVFFQVNNLLLRNTAAINILDGCAISIPCHRPGSLPVGLSIAGMANQDAKVLAVARLIEKEITKAYLS